MEIAVDRGSATPLYLQISRRISELILAGSLPAGFRLPPERRLATALAVNRTTVLAAYRELKADGLVDAHVGRGTVVLAQRYGAPAPHRAASLSWRQLFRPDAADRRTRSSATSWSSPSGTTLISLAVGLPAPELLPLDDAARGCIDRDPRARSAPTCSCTARPRGSPPLREALADLVRPRGIDCAPAEVLVTVGLAAGPRPGRAGAALARATSSSSRSRRSSAPCRCSAPRRRRLLGVPTDDDGMRTDVLEAVLAAPPARSSSTRCRRSRTRPARALARRAGTACSSSRTATRCRSSRTTRTPSCATRAPRCRSLGRSTAHGHVHLPVDVLEDAVPRAAARLDRGARPVMLRQLVLAKQIVDLHSEHARPVDPRPLPARRPLPRSTCARVRAAYGARRDVVDRGAARGGGPRPGVAAAGRRASTSGAACPTASTPAGCSPARPRPASASCPGGACFVDEPRRRLRPAQLHLPAGGPDRARASARFAGALRDVVGEPADRGAGSRPVRGRSSDRGSQTGGRMTTQFARRMEGLKASEIRELLKVTQRPEVISFAGGLPAPELFPVRELAAGRPARARGGRAARRCSTRRPRATRRCAGRSRARMNDAAPAPRSTPSTC